MEDKVMNKLTDEQLEGVAGGYIFDASVLTPYPNVDYAPYQVLDDKGNVVAAWDRFDVAWEDARQRGLSQHILSWEQVQKLRETGSPW